jgi:hydroxyacylglutathione hydrolase
VRGNIVILEQFYLGCLAHASYLIGSDGLAAVVDPQRDVGLHLEAASRLGLRIAHIIETHLHADFVSGHQELAQRTGATIYLGEGSGASFAHRAVRDGDALAFGRCRLEFLQTPGHTPESVCVVVTDLERSDKPYAVLTGDTLFIGDAGRPDLCETKTPAELARLLYDSLRRKLLALPDETLVYPAHGAGSMCGRNIGADRSSTIGRERLSNHALQPMPVEQFVEMMTQDLPPRPEYFHSDVEVNRRGAPALDSFAPLSALAPAEVERHRQEGALLLDTRAPAYYCSGHVAGSLQIGLGGQFAAWAGTLIGLDRDVILVAEDRAAAEEARMRLARVGIDRAVGVLEDGIAGWARARQPLTFIDQVTVQDLHAGREAFNLVDVRQPPEWNAGHIPGSILRPLNGLRSGLASLNPARPTAVHCKGGYRSTIACSILEGAGFGEAVNVIGGFDAWVAAGLPRASE